MFKFAAILWNPHNVALCDRARRLAQVLQAEYGGVALDANGLRVYYARTRPSPGIAYSLHGNRGIVLGQLLSRRSTSSFNANETTCIVDSCGRHLLREHWGRYVAFLHDPESCTTRVIHDPTASLPCFIVEAHGLHIVFSDISDCDRLGQGFSIDWDWITAQLTAPVNERLDGTALSEIRRLHGGECVTVSRDSVSSTFYWDPQEVAKSDLVEDPRKAAEATREVVSTCVSAWASCYDGIVHRLSGGLDSSIVAYCLGNAPSAPNVTCFNHYSPGAESDERRYARLAAAAARLPLIEHPRDPAGRLEPLLRLRRYPYPLYCRYSLDYGRYEADLARQTNASAIFSGEWGDALFHLPYEEDPAIDYVSRHGVDRSMLRVALDTARLNGSSFWFVLSTAIRQGRIRSERWDPRALTLNKYRSLLTEEAIRRARSDMRFLHPWLRRDVDIPIGKYKHIHDSLLVDLNPPHDPLGRPDDPELVAPLNSQPLIELSLRIPTYVLSHGGWSRAIARRAFTGRVPDEIITRRTKGAVSSYQKSLLMRNIRFIRDFLLDGALVRHGIVDRQKLEAALGSEPTTLSTMAPELQWYLYTEAWVASWRGHQQHLAA